MPSINTTAPIGRTVTHGPFTWVKVDRPMDETWQLDRETTKWPAHFVIKNYGGEPGSSAFAGWMLVSGGPFAQAGSYNTFEEAVQGITPWLKDCLASEARQELASARAKLKAINGTIKALED